MRKVIRHASYIPRPLRPRKNRPTFQATSFADVIPIEDECSFIYASYIKHLPVDKEPCSYDGASLVYYDDDSIILIVIVGVNGRGQPGDSQLILETTHSLKKDSK